MNLLANIWRLLTKRQRRQLVLLQLLSLLASVTTLGGIAAVVPFLSVLADPQLIGRNQTYAAIYSAMHFSSLHTFLIVLGIAFVVALVAANVVSLASTLAINRFSHSLNSVFQVTLFDEYLKRDLLFHSRTGAATLHNKLVNETSRATIGLIQSVLTLISGAVLVMIIVVSIAVLSSALALLVVAALIGTYAMLHFVVRRRLAENGRIQSVLNSHKTRLINECLGSIKELRLLSQTSFLVSTLKDYCRALANSAASNLAIAQFPKPLLESAMAGALVATALIIGNNAAPSTNWLGTVSFLGLAAYRLLPALQQAFAAAVRIGVDSVAFTAIFADLQNARAVNSGDHGVVPHASWAARPAAGISIRNLSFRYAAEQPPTIGTASLFIRAGTMVAIVGANGTGKTTFVDLLLGLLDPESGIIEIDGEPLIHTNRASWRAAVAYVPQSVFLFNASLAANIALGVPPDLINHVRLHEAAHITGLGSLAGTLPGGFDGVLGPAGRQLSGGERQRVGLARALYRDATFLVLDEATSALDSATEAEVMQAIESMRGRRTIVVVTHDPETIRRCDAVFEVRNGWVSDSQSIYAQQERA